MDLGLAGKTALVTGSNRGTGSVIADHLEAEGVTIIRHDIAEQDIATPEGCDQLLATLGQVNIDILVNNYGTTNQHNWSDTDTLQWLQMYQVNALSAARLAQALYPGMQARGWGRIINLGTIGSHAPCKVMPAYYAAKGALANMTVSLAQELGATGITVNCVAPGLILTPEVERFYKSKAARKGWGDDWEAALCREEFPNPVNRIARREEVADLVCFLASDRAAYINGQILRLDGGAITHI